MRVDIDSRADSDRRVGVRLLGPVEVRYGDRRLDLGPRKQRLVLAVLALEANRQVPVDRLIDLVWLDPPRTAKHALQVCVSRLRSSLAGAGIARTDMALATHGQGYALSIDPQYVDAHRFRALLAKARDAGGDRERVEALDAALALWSGDALAGTATEEVSDRLAGGLTEARLVAYEDRFAALVRLGRHSEVLDELTGLAAAYPERQRLVANLMLALHRSGQSSAALEVYRRTRAYLADELGLDPTDELRQLELAILRDDVPPPERPPEAPVRRGGVPAQLPRVVSGFVGRTDQLAKLDGLLGRGESTVVISAIGGTAGVGKTALAVYWAHRAAGQFPDGQLYVNLRGFDPGGAVMGAGEALGRLLHGLGLPAERVPAGVDERAALYRSTLAGRRMLVLLDNARDAEQVRPLLPGTAGCLVLVTSRDRLTPLVATEAARPLTLDVLPDGEARALLAGRLGGDRIDAEPEAVDELIERCARLPLALAIVAARHATEPDLTLAALAKELRADDGLDALDAGDPASNVRAVFSWSYHSIGPDSARLFRLLGLHPGPDISAAAAASLSGHRLAQVRPWLAELTRANLLTEYPPGRYTFHDLLRAYARDQVETAEPVDGQRAALHRLLDHYLHSAYAANRLLFPARDAIELDPPAAGVTPEAPGDGWFTDERDVLLAVVAHAAVAGYTGHVWRLAWTLATFLDWQGLWPDLIATHRAALDAARELGDRFAEGYALRALGLTYDTIGQLDDAYGYTMRARTLCAEEGDLLGEATAELNLARIAEHQGRYAVALGHSEQALVLYRALGHRIGEARSLNNIGWGYAMLGDYPKTLTYSRQALTIHQQLDDREGASNAWDSLGLAHLRLGNHGQAIGCYQHTLSLYRELGDRVREAETLVYLGDTHDAAGEPGEARTAWQRALGIFDEVGHVDTESLRAKLSYVDSDHSSHCIDRAAAVR